MKKLIFIVGSLLTFASCQKNEQKMNVTPAQTAQKTNSWTEIKIRGLGFWAYDGHNDELRCFDQLTTCYEVIVHAPRNDKWPRMIVVGDVNDDGVATGDLEIHTDVANEETMQLTSFEGDNVVTRDITDFYQKSGDGYRTIKFN